nr:hypothetical protein [Tanacetum cinerariifolium]
MIVHDPFQMELSEMKLDFMKWETILSENVISLTGNKDHLNGCLIYMLYCLATQKPFNLIYYMAKRMAGVTKNDMIVLPYGMLLTRLYRHVSTIQLKRPHPPTSSSSSSSQSQSHDQEEFDLVANLELEPIEYCDQPPPFLEHRRNSSKQKEYCEDELNPTLVFITDYVDAFDLYCDEEAPACAIFMAKLSLVGLVDENDVGSSYDSDALSEIPTYNNNDMLNLFVHETQHYEQSVSVNAMSVGGNK